MEHPGEIRISVHQLRELLADQFPHLAMERIEQLPIGGTDHVLFRIGESLLARMPRVDWAAEQAAKDAAWLPMIQPFVNLNVPSPVGIGKPSETYPWPWSLVPWIRGENPHSTNTNLIQAARSLGEFCVALRCIPTKGGPVAKPRERGAALQTRDSITREAIIELGSRIDSTGTLDAWERALEADPWRGDPSWVHGDLDPGNLLVKDGNLVAVIDFGALDVGDPAVDLLAAWSLFQGESRSEFRKAAQADEAMWERGKGWALTTALIALPYYWEKSPSMVKSSLHKIEQVLADCG